MCTIEYVYELYFFVNCMVWSYPKILIYIVLRDIFINFILFLLREGVDILKTSQSHFLVIVPQTGLSGNAAVLTVFYYGGVLMSDSLITVGQLSSFMLYATTVGIAISGRYLSSQARLNKFIIYNMSVSSSSKQDYLIVSI